MSTDVNLTGEDVWEVVQDLTLPLALIELEQYTVVAATPSLLGELGVSAQALLHQPVFELFDDADRESSKLALEAIANGLVDFYRSHRRLRSLHNAATISVWVRALEFGERRLALAEYSASQTPRDSPLVEHVGYSPPLIALGTTDVNGIVVSVSDSARTLLQVEPSQMVGHPLLTSDEQQQLCHELDRAHRDDHYVASISLKLRTRTSVPEGVRCIITSLADSASRWFLLISGPDPVTVPRLDRVAQLEHRLWRIASEVQASGIFDALGAVPDAKRFPQLTSLTPRQWEVLSRLLRGERVATIAAALFVSQSTVRTNLSELFRIFGVHSQSALIELLS